MTSSKSRVRSSLRQKRSTLSIPFPSFPFSGGENKEAGLDKAHATVMAAKEPPRSGSTSSSSTGSDVLVHSDPPLSRRRSWMPKSLRRASSRPAPSTSIIPSLTTTPPLDLPNGPEVHRKPVPSSTYPPPTNGDVHYPPYDGHDSALPPPTVPQLPPFEKLQPLEPPTKHSESHARKSSIPNMLKKIQKAATLPQADHPPPPPQKELPLPPIPSVTETGASPPVLKKTRGTTRSSSAELAPPNDKLQPKRLQTRRLSPSPSPEPKGRSVSAQPPPSRSGPMDGSRVSSGPNLALQTGSGENSPIGESRGRLRRSWLPGGRSRSGSEDLGKGQGAGAWVMSPGGTADYNTAILVNGEKVSATGPETSHPT